MLCDKVFSVIKDAGGNAMRSYTVKMSWDEGVWCASSDEELGITLESGSFDALVERVRTAAPEMLELNCGYTGAFNLVFVTERTDTINLRHVG